MVDRRSVQISVIAHASILAGFLFRYSFIIPLLMWKTMKHSKYSEFQARQAAYYQMAVLLIILTVSFTAELAVLLSSADGRVQKADDLLVKEIELGAYALLSLYALYGAYRCSKGEEFKYVLIGKM